MISTLKKKSIQKAYDKLVVKKENIPHKETKVKSVAILLDNEALVNVVIANLTNIFPFQKTDIRVLKTGGTLSRVIYRKRFWFQSEFKIRQFKRFR